MRVVRRGIVVLSIAILNLVSFAQIPRFAKASAFTLIGENNSTVNSLFNQQNKLRANDRDYHDFLGTAVVIAQDGNTALIGAPGKSDLFGYAGAAYVFVRNGVNWTQQAKLLVVDSHDEAAAGYSLALSADGNTALVGAFKEQIGAIPKCGAVYVFTRSGITWSQQARLSASDPATYDFFGRSLALSADGNSLLAGADGKFDGLVAQVGAVYYFTRSGTTWTQQAKLLASDRIENDFFGRSIAMSGDGSTAFIALPGRATFPFLGNGVVYTFTKSGGVWTENGKLSPNDAATNDGFGIALQLSADGNTAIIGAPNKSDSPFQNNGAAYIFTRNGALWQQQAKLSALDKASGDIFGGSLSLSSDGTIAIASAISSSDIPALYNGAAYIFARNGTSWTEQMKLLAADRADQDHFGAAVAVSGDGNTVFVGASYEGDNSGDSAGSVYVFTTPSPRPDTIGAYLNGTFYLRNSNTTGGAEITTTFGGVPSDLPIVGDWNGDGVDTIGVYRNSTGFFFLSDSNTSPAVNYTVLFGNPGDTPFAGRWTADMTHDGIGVYRNTNGILYQRKSLTSGFDDFFAVFGNPGDQGVAGDWDGNGFDSIGIYRSSNSTWYLTNNSTPSGITFSDINFVWNLGSFLPVVGDWDANGSTTVGLYNNQNGTFLLHSTNAVAGTDNLFSFGPVGSKPIAGKWVTGSRPPLGSVIRTVPNPNTDNTGDSSNAD